MAWTNFHNHCYYDDGKCSPKEHIEQAIRQNVDVLGFSCHAPLPFEASWTLTNEGLIQYFADIEKLKDEFKDKIKVFLGLEIDYIPGIHSPNMEKYKQMNLYYSISSNHHLEQDDKGVYIPVDGPEEMFVAGLKSVYKGNIKRAVETYYNFIEDMINLGGFDILGHLDLIKIRNNNNKYFSEDEKWYRDIISKIIGAIRRSGCIVEVNTGGMARKYTDDTYPSLWILEECFKKGIPITLNSDSHSPENIIFGFEKVAKDLISIGYKEIFVLDENGWKPRALA